MGTKWYETVEKNAAEIKPDTRPFDLGQESGFFTRLASRLTQSRRVHAIFRNIYPFGKIPFTGMYWAFRYQQVREIRDNSGKHFKDIEVFETPYGREMRALLGGDVDAALGMRDGPEYRAFLNWMKAILDPDDIDQLIKPNAEAIAESLVDYAAGEIDAIKDLQTRVSVETCADYFGLRINHPDEFAQWMMSMSAVLFSDPFGDEEMWRTALRGARNVRDVIDAAYERTLKIHRNPSNFSAAEQAVLKKTLMGRLVAIQQKSSTHPKVQRPTKPEIRSMMVVLATGWVPTGAAAGGNILQVLLKNSAAMRMAQEAANKEDDEALAKCLMEAMRFRPPINPGLPRYASEDVIIERQTWRGKLKTKIRKGEVVMAAAASAMFDGRAEGLNHPGKFDPERHDENYSREVDLQFGGFGILHYCIGEDIAKTMLTQSFKPLLRQKKLKRAHGRKGNMRNIGAFPQSLFVTYDPVRTRPEHSIVTITIPMVGDPKPNRIRQIDSELDSFGNPAQTDLQNALAKTGVIHFAHVSTVPGTPIDDTRRAHADFLLVEICVDGNIDHGVEVFVQACGDSLRRVLKLTGLVYESGKDRASLLKRNITAIKSTPFPIQGASGLEFYGTPELTVRQIEEDDVFAEKARTTLEEFLTTNAHRRPAGSEALEYVRTELKQDAVSRAKLVRPSHSKLAINKQGDQDFSKLWGFLAGDRDVLGMACILISLGIILGLAPYIRSIVFDASGLDLLLEAFAVGVGATLASAFLLSRRIKTPPGQEARRLGIFFGQHKFAIGLGILSSAFFYAIWADKLLASGNWLSLQHVNWVWPAVKAIGSALGQVVPGLIGIAALVAVSLALVAVLLRRSEKADTGHDIDPDLGHVKEVTELENPEGYVQNHIVAVTELKTDPRWLRRLTLGFGFFWVLKLVTYLYRPGMIIDMGTIHFARWFRLPGTDKLIFTANYDGSWESYLEDFITKAQWGQTAVWGNGVGFPESKWLFYEGAGDGARFKRWVRRQQRRTRFWYSRYPELSTDQIRNNSLICEGLAKASTEAQAKAWVDLFGSRPRPSDALEHSEIQSLILKGLGKYLAAEVVPIRFPENADWAGWLSEIIVETTSTESARVGFGEKPKGEVVLALALSAEGFQRLGLQNQRYTYQGHESNTLASFPEAFVSGMANDERARILGDLGTSHPQNWTWRSRDTSQSDWPVTTKPAHAILLFYGKTREALKLELARQKKHLVDDFAIEVGPSITLRDLPKDLSEFREPFGFRDGISQPILKGSKRARSNAPEMHTVQPGEFILGYPDNRGDFPHSPMVMATEAEMGDLEPRPDHEPRRFPDFNESGAGQLLDFGRNGSFLVMRQLKQYADEFDTYLKDTAKTLTEQYEDLDISPEWLAAKMIGRQKDGASLLADPLAVGSGPGDDAKQPDNDFLFGVEDPQGLKCPYGAHVRRANPRDSLSPKSEFQVEVTNRHRLLRRGRSYVSSPDRAAYPGPTPKDDEKADGLLFMCFNSDLERQFEFVQQTWMSARIFHGLDDERDPIVSAKNHPDALGTFTIPTEFGPIQLRDLPSFVSVLNGGYFFVPSRAALRFLSKMDDN